MERRECTLVIAQMLEKIPSSETELINDLKWNLKDASYKAPEETLQWDRTYNTLVKHIPGLIEDWQFEVVSIFTTRPVEELKNEIKKI